MPGSYYLVFVAPSGYELSLKDQGLTDAKDSDADQTTWKTDPFLVLLAQQNRDLDAGVHQLASIGDKVWDDANENGVQDDGSGGVNNVIVKLLNSLGVVLRSTTTSGGGIYAFNNVSPGSYKVKFEFDPLTQAFTTKDAGSDDTIDSDPNTTTGITDLFPLSAGQSNLTIDAGLILDHTGGDGPMFGGFSPDLLQPTFLLLSAGIGGGSTPSLSSLDPLLEPLTSTGTALLSPLGGDRSGADLVGELNMAAAVATDVSPSGSVASLSSTDLLAPLVQQFEILIGLLPPG